MGPILVQFRLTEGATSNDMIIMCSLQLHRAVSRLLVWGSSLPSLFSLPLPSRNPTKVSGYADVSSPAGSGAEPRPQTHFGDILSQETFLVAMYIHNSYSQ